MINIGHKYNGNPVKDFVIKVKNPFNDVIMPYIFDRVDRFTPKVDKLFNTMQNILSITFRKKYKKSL